jgi:two-component system cell cycle sensor histidine kinase/response regulator CckA
VRLDGVRFRLFVARHHDGRFDFFDGVQGLQHPLVYAIAPGPEGPGIPPEIRDRAFDPFFTTKASGTGLGLATVQSILSRHGGSVELESSPGGGTTFRLRLRAAETAPAPRAKPGSAEPRQGRVLVMDDEPVVLEVATAALEYLGYTMEGTADGERTIDAFDRARSEGRPFDVVILDLTVAGAMGGVGTLSQLRAREPGLRAIARSGYSSDPVLAQPATFGFSGTLPKPYTIAELAAVVDSVLRSTGRPAGA